ncbi:MAG: family 10 glycosylhydrolase [Lachnospiraceae bacterium]|nr:family 10 glycosylhydrolase [Lachnospiraceae bacterium]
MRKKRLCCCLLALILIMTGIFVPRPEVSAATIAIKYGGKKYTYGTKKQTSATVNGKKISSKIPGLIINNTNVVPVKVFKNASLGISYSYNSSKKVATFKKNGTTLKLTMGSKIAKVNGKKVTMSAKAERMYLVSNKTYYLMVPARFVAEKLGFTYVWNNEKRLCTINNKVKTTTTPKIITAVPVTKAPTITKKPSTPAVPTAMAKPTPTVTATPVITVKPANTKTPTSTKTPSVISTPKVTPTPVVEEEMKAVWISYLEFSTTKQTETQFKKKINTMFDNCVSYGMNTVIVQVRPFSDAMYKSDYFPWSRYASGTQGTDPGYDPLEIMVDLAHKKGLKIQAWLNPYRVTLGSTSASSLASGHPAKKWMNSTNANTKRNVLSYGGNLYYNPSKSAVRTLIVNGVKEIVKNYDIDGIHFDDYFYPSFDTSNYQNVFDAPEYETYVKNCEEAGTEPNSIVSWRRGNVNKLVREVYAAVKELDSNVVFGISPAGNIDNLLSNVKYYANVKTWMSNTNYVDYICPQIYWSFQNKVCPYAGTVDRWISLKKSDTVKLYIGIAVYRAGTDAETEWKNSNDVLKRQIVYGRNKKEVSGFCFYRYDSFQAATSKKELANLLPLLK